MGRGILGAVLLGGLLAAASPAARADNRGFPARNGDEVAGVIAPADDVDCFLLNLPAGGSLSVKVSDQKTGLLPAMSVRRPDGSSVDLGKRLKGAGKAKLSLKALPVDATGPWAVCVGGTAGTTGAYKARFTWKYPGATRSRGAIISGGGVRTFPAPGVDGALLSFSLKEKIGSPLSAVRVLDPSGAAIPLVEGTIVHKGTKWSGRKILLSRGFGTYAVEARAVAGADAVVDGTVTVRPPRPEKRTMSLALEPRPTDMDPEAGRDGIRVTVTGAAFAEGARVFFGSAEATDVEVIGSGELECTAPASEASDAGGSVEILVTNPDGQENAIEGKKFQYHGRPDPDSVAPTYAPLAGGITLTITGKNFRGGTDPAYVVTVGGVEAEDVTILGAGTLTCTAPNLGAPGIAAVTVTDEFGREGTILLGPRYVGPPTVSGAEPATSSFTGGRLVSLDGDGFRAGNRVFVGADEASPVEFVSQARLRFPMPAGPAGAYDVVVVDEFGQASAAAVDLVRRRGPFVNRTADLVPAPPTGNEFFATALGLGDLDGDGDLDVLGAAYFPLYYDTGYLPASFLLLNQGDGSLEDETASRHAVFTSYGDFGQSRDLVLGDLDGESGAEAALFFPWAFPAPAALFYVGSGSGGPLYGVYVAPYYGYYYVDSPTYPAGRLLANDGSGNLSDATGELPVVSSPFFGMGERWQGAASALGDLDGDGSQDIVVTSFRVATASVGYVAYYANFPYNGSYYNTYVYYQTGTITPATRILANDGAGGFTPFGTLPPTNYFGNGYVKESFEGNALALGDLDGDGDTDIVVSRYVPNYYYSYYAFYYLNATRVLRNGGDGIFTPNTSAMPTPFGATTAGAYSGDYWQADALALGDLDVDGDLDLVLGRASAYYWFDAGGAVHLRPAIRLFRNNGTGRFTEATGGFLSPSSYAGFSTDTILGVRSIQIGDLDGDGSPDILVTGAYTGQYDSGTGYGPYGIIPAGDRPATRLLLNDGAGTFTDVTDAWMPNGVNGDFFQGEVVRIGDLDGDDDLDVVVGSEYFPFTSGLTVEDNRPLRVLTTK